MRITFTKIKHPNFMNFYKGSAVVGNKRYTTTAESKEKIRKAFKYLISFASRNYETMFIQN